MFYDIYLGDCFAIIIIVILLLYICMYVYKCIYAYMYKMETNIYNNIMIISVYLFGGKLLSIINEDNYHI